MKASTKFIHGLTLSLFFILFINICTAKDIYVSPSGKNSNNCGSSLEPCPNIKVALELSSSGDQILLQSGTFTGPLNVGLEINVASLRIKGVGQSTIIDLQSKSHAFIVFKPNVQFVDLAFRNGFSSDSSLAGGITARLQEDEESNPTSSISFSNVVFKDIIGGGLLIISPTASSSSSSSSSSTKLATIQAKLVRVEFENVSEKPAVSLLGNIQAQLKLCNFKSNGFDFEISSTSSSTEVIGAAIYATGNDLGFASSPTLSLDECSFIGNKGITIIDVADSMSASDLMFIGRNSFTNNIASKNVIHSNPQLSMLVCVSCDVVWKANQAPKLCEVSCNLLGISSICPQSCPTSLALDI